MSTLKTGKVKTTTIADELDTESTAVTNVINGSAKAWVNFNGTGAVAIRRGFNVSSLVDVGTGYYTVNFTTAMTDANFSVCSSGRDSTSTTLPLTSSAVTFSTTSTTLRFLTNANADRDSDIVSVAVFS